MSCSSNRILRFAGALLLTLLTLGFGGCMADRPADRDIPWAAPAGWEGTMPLPGGYMNRYD
ncbi:MAG: hypothetical protein J6336_01895 [Kiritimatiellae bacterium]|nr:hypothetical protein [Kiritimatiellia bacterium]